MSSYTRPKSEAEKQKELEEEKNAKTTRLVQIWAVMLSALAIFVSAAVSFDNNQKSIGVTAAVAGTSMTSAQNNVCMSWVTFVMQQQALAATTNEPPDVADAGIDRVGQVVWSRTSAESQSYQDALVALYKNGQKISPEPSGPVTAHNIATHCGSAHEIRVARHTSDALDLAFAPNG